MSFKIKNLRPTFLTIQLTSQPVTINSRGEAGPFEDEDWSPGLTMAENRGDVATVHLVKMAGANSQPPQKTTRIIKEDNPS